MASPSKKRKREALDTSESVPFRLADQPVSQLGPVLVSFPALEPPRSTPFKCYLRKKPKNEEEAGQEFVAQSTFVAGEAESVEFFSSDESQRASVGIRYLVGVHNKRTGTTTLRAAPLHLLTHRVKALKGTKSAPVSAQEHLQARATLGETFGTKKAKANIRARERNRVDVSAMEGVAEHLQDRIEQSTGALPTQEEAKETADSNRLIPPYDPDAEVPGDVYPLHDIIPEAEWKALSVSAFTAAPSNNDRIALLPYSRSNWINQHLNILFAASVLNKKNLKILYYISTMLAFRNATSRKFERSTVEERLSGVPSIVIDGLFSRFTESSRGSTK
jgi:DNA-directed RNA polymerase I subunit RPA49